MLKRLMSRTLLAVFMAFASMFANATLVAGSDSFVDTTTHLEWLEGSFTVGLTADQVLASNSVKVDGYRIAKYKEVQKLFLDAGFTTTYGQGAASLNAASSLLNLFGGCQSGLVGRPCGNATEYWLLGSWDFTETRSYAYQPYSIFGVIGNTIGYAYDEDMFPGHTYNPHVLYRADMITFLVRDAQVAAVPEPGTVCLVLLGVVGLAAGRQRGATSPRAAY